MGEDDDDCGGGVGGEDVYKSKAEPMLVLVLDLYSEDDSILVCDSRPSSSPVYTAADYFSLLATALKKMYMILA